MRRLALLLTLLVLAAACRANRYDSYAFRSDPLIPPSAYEHYIRGRVASIEGNHNLAIAEFRLAAAVAPGQPELRIAVASELLAAGMTEHARQELAEILDRWPGDARAWRLLGRVYARGGDAKRAIAAYEQALAHDARHEETYLLLAAGHRQLGDATGAERTYRALVAAIPLSIEGHFRLGRSLLARRDFAGARVALERAVELEPSHIDARVALAEAYRKQGEPDRARDTLREAFDRSGDDPGVGERLFRVLLESGDHAAAHELVKSLDGEWRDPRVRVSFGYLYLTLRKGDEALAVAIEAKKRDPKLDAARLLEARALAQLRRPSDAFAALREVAEDSDHYAEARALAGELAARDGKPKDGLTLVEEALAKHPRDVTLIAARASLYEKLGDPAKATSILDEALAARPTSEELVYARASLAERQGDPDRAVAIMRKLLDDDADNVLALNFIGYLYANRGVKLDDAERLLARALELRPDDGYVLDSWGWYLVQRGRLDEARDALERADRLSPFEPEILLHLGELYVRRGDTRRAREAFERALALDPDERVRVRLEEGIRTVDARRADP